MRPPAKELLDEAAERVENAIIGALHRDLRGQDDVVIAYSGGLDSTVLARLVMEYMDGNVHLVTVGVPGSRDIERARRNARFLDLPLVEATVSVAALERDLATIVGLVGRTPVPQALRQRVGMEPDAQRVSPVLVGVQSTLFYVYREARRLAERVILGQGADELFGGYQRYMDLTGATLRQRMKEDLDALQTVARPVEARVAEHFGVQPRYPYLHEGVIRAARELPDEAIVHDGVRKRVLRHVAQRCGLPADVIRVPKTAAQYGSGLAGLLESVAKHHGRPQHEHLEGLLGPPARA